jgi:acetoin utilization deacetylase AcuC-like enzyme
VDAVMAGVADVALELGSDLEIVAPQPAATEALTRVHAGAYLTRLEEFCRVGGGNLDPDTFARPDSWEAALLSAGAGLQAIDALRRRNDGAAFVATRPPGHHALAERAMGFCLLNNVAVSAAALVAEGERVLIVDWDVHHGNGTQALFWDDPSVLYVSTHQSPFYPGTGGAAEVGGDEARGLTVNVPLPAGATGDVVRRALDEVAAPVIEAFGPTWVLISAGFDAHRADPLADLALSSGDFADLARTVSGYAPQPGRLVMHLEGGYDLGALRDSVAATLGALADLPERAGSEPATAGGPGEELVDQAAVERERALDR